MKNKSIWHILTIIACCGLTVSSIGLVFNCIGVFYSPISSELGVGRGTVALFATLCSLANGLCAPLFGRLLKRFPLRAILSVAILVAGLSTMAISLTHSVWQLYAIGVIQGVALSFFSSVPVTVILTNWFEQKHGLATGVAFCFSGVGGAVFSPMFSMLISAQGWRAAFVLLGAAILLFALPGALLVLRLEPSERGLLPYGATSVRGRAPQPVEDAPRRDLRPSLPFVLLAALAVIASFCTGLTQHLPGFAESEGLSAATGAAMVSAAMLGNLSSKLIIGVVSDWAGPIRACLAMLSACLLALVLLLACPTGTLILALAAAYLFGFIYSVCSVGLPLVTRHVFGPERYAAVFPRVTVVASLGSSCAIAIIGFIYDFTHSYSAAFLCCAAFVAICCALLLALERLSGAPNR
ncbi:MAG: MFS transporter [Clostridia bacterium]|nr:MFS transporter [Clostridia bacterium]